MTIYSKQENLVKVFEFPETYNNFGPLSANYYDVRLSTEAGHYYRCQVVYNTLSSATGLYIPTATYKLKRQNGAEIIFTNNYLAVTEFTMMPSDKIVLTTSTAGAVIDGKLVILGKKYKFF